MHASDRGQECGLDLLVAMKLPTKVVKQALAPLPVLPRSERVDPRAERPFVEALPPAIHPWRHPEEVIRGVHALIVSVIRLIISELPLPLSVSCVYSCVWRATPADRIRQRASAASMR